MRLVYRVLPLAVTLATLCLCADQDVLTILKQQDGLASFTTYLELFPDIIDQLNNGTFTVLAPHDDAVAAFEANNTDISSDRDKIEALIQYHISHDTHPSATFGLSPLFPATLLTNPNYTNVTGGQRVEMMMLDSNKPTILSGLKAASHIIQPDIFYLGGLIHVVDRVLTIPVSFPATITAAGLNDLVALLNSGGWLTPSSPAVQIVNSVADLTIFGPNDPRYGATFTGFDSLTKDQLTAIFEYSIVNGTVVYSDLLKNNTKFKTMQGETVTITAASGGLYIDAAKITARDYLCSNGVLQVIDMPLNPETSGTRPAILPEEPAKTGGRGLSSAAAAGIGIAVGVLLLGGGIVAALVIRTRKKRRGTTRLGDGHAGGNASERAREGSMMPVNRRSRADGVELEFHGAPPRYGTHELDNKALEDGVQATVGTTVVELRQSPSPSGRGTGDGDEVTPTSGWRVYTGRSPSRSGTTNTAGHDRTASSNDKRKSTASLKSLHLKGPAGSGLPPSPPSTAPPLPPTPLEIDGRERSRISISITGEPPRHLGFQARY